MTDHVDIDSFWMAPWDAGGMLGDGCRPRVDSVGEACDSMLINDVTILRSCRVYLSLPVYPLHKD